MSETIVIDGEVSLDIPVDGEAENVIKVGHEIVTRTLTVTENGHYEPDFGVDGFSEVYVGVPEPIIQSKTVEPSGVQQLIEPDEGYDYLSSVTVTPVMNPLEYATTFGAMYNNAVLPENFEIDFAGNTHVSFNGFFRGSTGADKITIKNLPDNAIAMGAAFRECAASVVEFVGCTPKPSGSAQCLQGARIEEIIGAFDMSHENGDAIGLLYSANYLREIRFVEGTIGLTLDMNGTSRLSRESLISFANGLNGEVSGKELRRFAQKATTTTIYGTVTDGHFTEDEGGYITLAEYITNFKGWSMP